MSLNELIENDVIGKKVIVKKIQYTNTFDKNQLQNELKNKNLVVSKIDPNYWVDNNVEVIDLDSLQAYYLSYKDLELCKDEK